MEVEREFIGSGCNRVVNNVSWGPSGLVAFGAHNAISIFCPQSAQILNTLPGHKANVNCTQWLPTCKDAYLAQQHEKHYLLSGSADGVIMVWTFYLLERKWEPAIQVPTTHKKGVTCLTGMMLSQNVAIFSSSSSDGVIHVWKLAFPSSSDGNFGILCLDTLNVGSKPMVTLSLAKLPGNNELLVLAAGGLDNKVHLYCNDATGKFHHACELKGHTDWIRCLDFSLPIATQNEEHTLFLVSSSQDKTIRIWKIASHISVTLTQEISLSSYIEGPVFIAGLKTYQVSLESLLVAHEDWVYSVQWQPSKPDCEQTMSILSASMDKTMMIWRPEKTTGIWVNMVTVGELSHTALGFYGGHWAPDGNSILSHGYGGSFHLWKNDGADYENWIPQKVPSGHFASVSDIAWARTGAYLLSVSHDQTTRIFAPWKNEVRLKEKSSWHEITRPQVHGHDINCVAIINGSGNHKFVSGADEKVARVFEAPVSFLKTLNHAVVQKSNYVEYLPEDVQILGANMSALGLSQKPIYVHASSPTTNKPSDGMIDSMETIPDAIPKVLTQPPVEEQLGFHTLWPESHKLYGHGNELFSLCCDHEGKLVASSCKAQSVSVAEIWLWQVGSWKAVGRLQCHSLTVTQLEFSHDDSFLLAVSRDRQFSVFSIQRNGDEISCQMVAKQEAHKRIIWAGSWNPIAHQFATGSRDKTVKIWSIANNSNNSVKQLATLPTFKDSVTALSWTCIDRSRNSGILAVGMDNGAMEIWNIFSGNDAKVECSPAVVFDPFLCHVSTVHRLAWRKNEKSDDEAGILKLASCGADHCVRVFNVRC